MAFDTQQLSAFLSTHIWFMTGCSSVKEHVVKRLVDDYICACVDQLLTGATKTGVLFRIDFTNLGRSLRRKQVNKIPIDLLDIFDANPELRIFHVSKKGNVWHGLTEVTLNKNYSYMDLIKYRYDLLKVDRNRFNFTHKFSYNEYIEVDYWNLARYMGFYTLSPHNFHLCNYLLTQAEFNGGRVPQCVTEHVFGRRYYRGPNLQNCPRDIRIAALGACWEYDLENAAITWLLTEYQAYRNNCKSTRRRFVAPIATLRLIRDKIGVRTELAEDIFGDCSADSIGKIKEAITAISFGARRRVDRGNALYQILDVHAKRFIDHPWVKDFFEEQNTMRKTVVDKFEKVNRALWKNDPELKTALYGANGRKPRSIASFLYQQEEKRLLESMIKFAGADNVLLTVHDSIYVRNQLDLTAFNAAIKHHGSFYQISEKQHHEFE